MSSFMYSVTLSSFFSFSSANASAAFDIFGYKFKFKLIFMIYYDYIKNESVIY